MTIDPWMVTTGLATAGAVGGWACAWMSGVKRVALSDDLRLAKTSVRDLLEERHAQLGKLANVIHTRNQHAIRIAALDAENMALAESVVKHKRERDEALTIIQRRRAQAKEASRKGHAVQTAKALAKRASTEAATHQACAGEPWPSRTEVVAPVRERRASKRAAAAA